MLRWLLIVAQPGLAREGVALVVGVDRYEHLSALEHAEADSALLAETLRAGYRTPPQLLGLLAGRLDSGCRRVILQSQRPYLSR